jgi:uncharacterized membrane protein
MQASSLIVSFFRFANSKAVNYFDWIASLVAVVYGAYSLIFNAQEHGLAWPIGFIAFGLLGLYLAYKKPGKSLENVFKKK